MATRMERRDFLKVLGVSGAGASLFGCSSQGPERLLPYVMPPEEIVPGVATWYRTTCRECPAGCGMSVRTREGRAIKAEGNPLSPISHGKLCARGQASLHGLYDPDRIRQALVRDGTGWDRVTWDDAEQRLANALGQARGTGVLLTGQTTGTMDRLLSEFAAAFQLQRVRYEPIAFEAVRAASRMIYGFDGVPVHDFSQAEVVLSFGAEFMETWLSPVDYAHGFVQAHAYRQGQRGRFISVTPHQSLTDFSADEWLPARPGTEHLVALAMARVISERGGSVPGSAAGALQRVDVNAVAQASGVPAERILHAAREFANGGRSLAVGPGLQTSHGAATQLAVAVAVLNTVAGNVGRTVRVGQAEAAANAGSYAEMQALVARMRAGQVGALLVHGANPLYALPGADAFGDALERVPFVASFSSYLDETSARAHLLLPDHHFLESWGDYVPRPGVHALVQPVMTPVFDTKQTGDVLISVARRGGATLPTAGNTFYDYLRTAWTRDVHPRAGAGAGFDDWWRTALQAGVVLTAEAGTQVAPAAGAGSIPANFDLAGQPQFAGDPDGFYLVVYPSLRFYDGRLANRPWLQELPDPVSKAAWMSWVEVSPRTAERLDLDNGSIAEVETPYGRARLPVWRHPGLRDDTIAIQLGQGHEELGRYAKDRGVNPMKLLGAVADPVSGGLVWVQTRAKLSATGDWERLPFTAGRETQVDRHVAREVSLAHARDADQKAAAMMTGGLVAAPTAAHPATGATPPSTGPGSLTAAQNEHGASAHGAAPDGIEALADPNFHHWKRPPMTERVQQLQVLGGFGPASMGAAPQDYPPPGTHYGEYSEDHPRWGMAIDLERCIGCSACMTACYAENNIGIVGPRLVTEGRILSWIRIERYFEEGASEGEEIHRGTTFLPMLCQHCGNAPCEPVCPVYASYHTPDGLNAQVYNRCVGTRYCANNCPYKVRYFNYFTYEWPEPLNWQLNPEVTVREKGVMEKCTFCVQRIRDAQHRSRIEGRALADGEITPACAQTCPGDAIVFGNMKDPNSRVARIAASGRGYRVLDELNTQSAIVYLKKVLLEADAGEAQH